MIVFVDECGDPGFKLERDSSKLFVIGLIMFNSINNATVCESAIIELRNKLKITDDYEFHFNNCSNKRRESFFYQIINHDFFYYAIVIDKSRISKDCFKDAKDFYRYACGMVFESAKQQLNNATVIIDKSHDKRFALELSSFLQKMNEKDFRFIKKVKMKKSAGNNLIQMADMITGAVNRSFKKKRGSEHFRRIIKHREVKVVTWPK